MRPSIGGADQWLCGTCFPPPAACPRGRRHEQVPYRRRHLPARNRSLARIPSRLPRNVPFPRRSFPGTRARPKASHPDARPGRRALECFRSSEHPWCGDISSNTRRPGSRTPAHMWDPVAALAEINSRRCQCCRVCRSPPGSLFPASRACRLRELAFRGAGVPRVPSAGAAVGACPPLRQRSDPAPQKGPMRRALRFAPAVAAGFGRQPGRSSRAPDRPICIRCLRELDSRQNFAMPARRL